MDEKWKKYIKDQALDEAEKIRAYVLADPEASRVHAPDDLEAEILAKIDAYEEKRFYENLSKENREYLELGKRYKQRRRWSRVAAALTVVLFAGCFSITSMGGAEKFRETVKWMLAGREQTNVDTEDERIEDMENLEGVTEEEAIAQVEEEYRFTPVKMYYLPEGMEFKRGEIHEEIQGILWVYQDKEGNALYYTMYPNYRLQSIGNDVEDGLVEEYVKKIGDATVTIKHYQEKEVGERWKVEFEYQKVFYYIQMHQMTRSEVEKVLENLYFPPFM